MRLLFALLLAASASAHATDEPKVERNVIEDDGARIEELKVRGETKKVSVQPKNSKAPAYEVIVEDAGRQSAAGSDRNATAGRRVWQVLKF